jgi:cyclopropane-fatty-acyl-phospholipid synthase
VGEIVMSDSRLLCTELLSEAGITVGGSEPYDIQVHDDRLYDRIISDGSLGLGESYMDGWWDVPRLDQFFDRILRAKLERRKEVRGKWFWKWLRAWLLNMQTKSRSKRVAQNHYDLGNEFYQDMLDPRVIYTCAYWDRAQTLEQAQEDKCELICRKLQLKPTDTVLDLGCGWGGFAIYAAEKYGCHVTGYNISAEQIQFAKKRARDLPVEFVLADYREAHGCFDKIVSIGMFEHVGPKNYSKAISQASQLLTEDGLFLLHTIGRDGSTSHVDPWVDKYIFPGGVVPSMSQIVAATEERFVVEHFHSFGQDYDRTLMSWYSNFVSHWHRHSNKLDERFYRMWSYYLLSCAGSFRACRLHLWQWVFSKHGVDGGYRFSDPFRD